MSMDYYNGLLVFSRLLFLHVKSDSDYDPKEAKKLEKELMKMEGRQTEQKRYTMRGLSKAVSLAAKLSPKSKRRKDKILHIAEFQVKVVMCFQCPAVLFIDL